MGLDELRERIKRRRASHDEEITNDEIAEWMLTIIDHLTDGR